MTENMKRFLEEASKDKELAEKVKTASDMETIIGLAKDKGSALTQEDLEPQPLSDEEVDAVAGGGECFCAMGGGGTAGQGDYLSSGKRYDKTCVCVLAGSGKYEIRNRDGSKKSGDRCGCPVLGMGGSA